MAKGSAAISQPSSAIWAIILSASLIPAIAEGIGIVILGRYRLDAETQPS
ncbi:MAG: hypothetical protein ABW169_13320 [Sphingobium sp.]